MRRRAAALAILASACCAVGCADQQDAPTGAGGGVARVAEAGGVRVEVRADRETLTTAQLLNLSVVIDVEPDAPRVTPEGWPEDGALGGFTVLRRERRDEAMVYVLEPFLPGAYEIPALRFAGGSGERRVELATEPIQVQVESVLAAEGATPAELKGVVEPPRETPAWVIALAAAGGALALGLIIAGACWARRRARTVEVLWAPASDIALQKLARLEAQTGAARPDPVWFYHESSALLRTYIEDRFSVRAPEQTTEEFLAATRDSLHFAPQDHELLAAYLRRADLVKFAGHEPGAGYARETIDLLRSFIERTRSSERRVRVEREEAAGLSSVVRERVPRGAVAG